MANLPLYHRVFLSLRDAIVNGGYERSQPMPSETALCAEYKVSRATIRRALKLLEEEGLVERRQGARTFPTPLGYSAVQRRNLDLLGREQNHIDMLPGEVSQSYTVVKPDKETWRQFAKQAQLGRVVRVRQEKGRPYCFIVTYMPLYIADKINWSELKSTPVITAALEAGFEFVKVEQTITATTANEEACAALEVPIGSALLRVSGLFIDSADAAIMRKDGYFHPDTFEYRTTLLTSS